MKPSLQSWINWISSRKQAEMEEQNERNRRQEIHNRLIAAYNSVVSPSLEGDRVKDAMDKAVRRELLGETY